MTDYVIIANGPFLVKEIIDEAIQDKIILALDGAANKLKALHIHPHIILGDFDSVDKDTQKYWGITQTFNEITMDSIPYSGNYDVLVVPAMDQNETDLVKAIRYCDQQSATSITIVCATAGREDHHEGTKMALKSEYKPNRSMIVHTESQSLRYAKNESVVIMGEPRDHCGVVATHIGCCTSEGLEYECNQHDASICNRLVSSSAILHINGMALLIMPPQLSSQREFMKKSATARLERLLRDAMA